ncbi:UMP kinase [Pyrobaculum aerophilum]|uniref:Uridylate kinase n=2 Tax=Pyrobaculum aerophilum TaxID=13773 RepID=PYRH_PYRAE|nr:MULTISPECIES: UMP kinase [Pyrobaculum]Q8ZTP3.1 RecName: Full=Uridylate kinase; Short=UK; AltName: Full=Uridine monophosphate kinase; Short=UMP kinase; Short=UMPK [Pyrobaculum aerophilum str. IM2]AAL64716.1 uridylate kinase (pyrH) [Pyrobaculum aerophilum str. IM2]MCX8136571.1 UMP kinase [Pyrobaculum aerophilum]RFA94909.1 UMP kinase [Pyrobaculum aerophilum]RFA98038.1 UMP kinase [Pyrobaculum aerophilum]HII46235.1 UMP kinase [Pyrobaculum aerophilum]
MALVIKLSGRVFEDEELVFKYAGVIRNLSGKVAVVTGGGEVARRYIAIAKRGGASNTFQDLLGIYASRLNALLLISLLKDAYPRVPANIEEFLEAWSGHRIVVTGGFQPGQSTATVAALVAEAVGASALLNAANIDAVYSDDPRRNPNAQRLRELKYDEFEKIIRSSSLPGGYELMDVWSISILKRNCITTYVFDGRRPDHVVAAARGENPGSKITC